MKKILFIDYQGNGQIVFYDLPDVCNNAGITFIMVADDKIETDLTVDEYRHKIITTLLCRVVWENSGWVECDESDYNFVVDFMNEYLIFGKQGRHGNYEKD